MTPRRLSLWLSEYKALRERRDGPLTLPVLRALHGFVDWLICAPTFLSSDDTERLCHWCQQRYPAEHICGLSETPERLCPGCYYCWRYGAPKLKRDTPSLPPLPRVDPSRAVLTPPRPRDD